MNEPCVSLLMGSDSDFGVMQKAVEVLRRFAIPCEVRVLSAHRTPEEALRYAQAARGRGLQVIIAGAGGAAHLAGVVAGATTLPVIGVPLEATPLGGLDALLSTVQMPPGVPVATVAVGEFGAHNAAVLAARILAVADPLLAARLEEYRRELAENVAGKNAALQARLAAGNAAP